MPKSATASRLLVLAALLASFAFGAICVQHQIFPYGLIRGLLGDAAAPTATPDPGPDPSAQPSTTPDEPPKGVDPLWWIDGITPPTRTKSGMYHVAPPRLDRGSGGDPAQHVAADTPYHRGGAAAPAVENVTIHDPDAAQDGVNLVLSAHAPAATLMDMNGNVLHTWSHEFLKVWPEPLKFFEWLPHKSSWRRVHVFPNGDLLAIFEGIGMIKIDRSSQLLWAYKGRTHHDIDVDDAGNIYSLARKVTHTPGTSKHILEDFVVVLSPDGKQTAKFSLLDAFLKSPYSQYVRNVPNMSDIFHTNTIELLDDRFVKRLPQFKKGSVLISIRNIDTIAVVDLERQVVTWALAGMWHRQHQPTVLDNGNLLLFDNLSVKRRSRVVELDPVTQQVAWQFVGTPEQPFDSPHSGSCQRLANGNTLITESVGGRAFEITPDGKIVWEYVSPHRAGENNELIAVLFEVVRLGWDDLQFPEVRAARDKHRAGINATGVKQLIDRNKK